MVSCMPPAFSKCASYTFARSNLHIMPQIWAHKPHGMSLRNQSQCSQRSWKEVTSLLISLAWGELCGRTFHMSMLWRHCLSSIQYMWSPNITVLCYTPHVWDYCCVGQAFSQTRSKYFQNRLGPKDLGIVCNAQDIAWPTPFSNNAILISVIDCCATWATQLRCGQCYVERMGKF